jgi:putative PIN family toxin of toxin-antitoxin system
LRLVLDTNTAISGLIWQGVLGQLIDAAVLGRVQLISTVPLLAELEGVLQRKKFREPIQPLGVAVADLFDGYAALVERVEAADLGGPPGDGDCRCPRCDEDPAGIRAIQGTLSRRALPPHTANASSGTLALLLHVAEGFRAAVQQHPRASCGR